MRQIVAEALERRGGADHLRRGARADRRPPGRRPAGLPHLGVARRDRRAARPVPRRRRVPGQPGPHRHRRPLHRRDGRVRLRPLQGRPHPPGGRAATASTWSRPTPTPTPTPTCRCSRRSATRWRSTPTGSCSRLARERSWEVRSFVLPVRLRDRRAGATGAGDRRRRPRSVAAGWSPAALLLRRDRRAAAGQPSFSLRTANSGETEQGCQEQELLHDPHGKRTAGPPFSEGPAPAASVAGVLEVSGHLVGSPAFKAGGRGDPTTAGSIPVHLRHSPLVSGPRRSADPLPRCHCSGDATWTWPGPRSGESARASG